MYIYIYIYSHTKHFSTSWLDGKHVVFGKVYVCIYIYIYIL